MHTRGMQSCVWLFCFISPGGRGRAETCLDRPGSPHWINTQIKRKNERVLKVAASEKPRMPRGHMHVQVHSCTHVACSRVFNCLFSSRWPGSGRNLTRPSGLATLNTLHKVQPGRCHAHGPMQLANSKWYHSTDPCIATNAGGTQVRHNILCKCICAPAWHAVTCTFVR